MDLGCFLTDYGPSVPSILFCKNKKTQDERGQVSILRQTQDVLGAPNRVGVKLFVRGGVEVSHKPPQKVFN